MGTLQVFFASLLVLPAVAFGQADAPDAKVVVVPYPGASDADAGALAPPPPPPPAVVVDAPPPPPPVNVPPPTPPEAVQPPATLVPGPDVMGTPQAQPGAFIDGRPREGAFLSGPGSMTFLLHQTSMVGLGVLSTQMVPRAVQAFCLGQMDCTNDPTVFTGDEARVSYLLGSLIGAGVGFGASAWWQFNHWVSHRSANLGIINSFIGGAFVGGLADLIAGSVNATPRGRAEAVTWSILVGTIAGSWLSMIVGGGDIPMNKATLVVSGAAWAMIYSALIAGMVVGLGAGGGDVRPAIAGLLITPAIGAAAMALATLKFNPSTLQIMRANLFGVGVGAAVFLLSGLVLGLNWSGPVPYVLGAVGAIGAKAVVSIFWVEAAEAPGSAWAAPGDDERRRKVSAWW